MDVKFYFSLKLKTSDYIKTMAKINDILQDEFPDIEINEISIQFGNITLQKMRE